MVDMAHISGLVATGEHPSPFEHAHVVTSTTHKSLAGPRSGIIFYQLQFKDQIDMAVFPGLQGGPHNHQIAGLATQLKEVAKPSFKEYSIQVKKNAAALAEGLMKRGHKTATDGTKKSQQNNINTD